jgi:hypothetical protein
MFPSYHFASTRFKAVLSLYASYSSTVDASVKLSLVGLKLNHRARGIEKFSLSDKLKGSKTISLFDNVESTTKVTKKIANYNKPIIIGCKNNRVIRSTKCYKLLSNKVEINHAFKLLTAFVRPVRIKDSLEEIRAPGTFLQQFTSF